MTDQNPPSAGPAPVSAFLKLVEQYPDCFDWHKPKPLKVGIHKDIMAAQSDENPISPTELRRTLWRYCSRPLYRKALQVGVSRIDLQGQPVGVVSEEEALKAKAERAAWKQAKKSGTPLPPRTGGPSVSPKDHLPPNDTPLPKEHLVPGRLELTVKFSELPQPLTVKNGIKIGIETGEGVVTAILSPKTWRKLEQAAAEYPQWVASMSGGLGQVASDGLEMKQPAIQVFERKAKPQEQASVETPSTASVASESETPVATAAAPQTAATPSPAAPGSAAPFPKLSLKDRAKPKES